MKKDLDKAIRERLEELKPNLVQSLKELVSIPSIIDEACPKFPFGENIDKALKKVLSICEDLGFETYCDPEGYYGYAEIGQGEEIFAILGHLDVVPVGDLNDWKYDPFEPAIIDGKMFGRGTQDDKGPTLASVYAAKALIDLGVQFNKRVRFIFGTDEETLWRGINKYVEKEEKPSMGFAPDSRFPLIYAEKGLLQFYLQAENETKLNVGGGNAFNSVPDSIVYKGSKQDLLENKLKELDYKYEKTDNGIKILGKSVHAQATEKGINAINRLAIALNEIGITSKAIDFISQEIKEDPYATNIFGICEDEDSGKLKFNVGKIDIKDIEQISIDVRVPVTVSKEEVVNKIKDVASRYGLEYRELDWLGSIYIPKDHELVKTLMDVYQEVTNDMDSEAMSSGGATYARAIDNCVAFGSVFPNRTKTEHQPNEFIIMEDLYKAMEIYSKAIYRLTK